MSTIAAATKPLPPGSFGLPLLGETLPFLKDTAKFLERRFKEHGTIFKTSLFGDRTVCLGGREGFAHFLDDRYFTREASSPKQIQELLNPDALPFIHDEKHKKRKRLILQAFRPAALDGYLPPLETILARYESRWEKLGSFAWVPELESMAFAIADALFVGADPTKDNEAGAKQFASVVDGMLALPLKLPFTTYGRALKGRDAMLAYVANAIREHRASARPSADLMAVLMRAKDDAGDQLSDRELLIEMVHFYFAAHSALYSALAYHLMLLAENPSEMEKVRAEVMREAPSGPLTMATIARLTYTHEACLESRRWAGVVPLTFFGRVREPFAMGGFEVPKGWKAFGLIAPTMRDPKIFADPDRFTPQRFTGESADATPHTPGYVAQGGGAEDGHRCAGEKLANVIMVAFTARILRSYTWTLPPQRFGPRLGRLSPTPVDDLKVVFSRVAAR
jgi:cytochrome P450